MLGISGWINITGYMELYVWERPSNLLTWIDNIFVLLDIDTNYNGFQWLLMHQYITIGDMFSCPLIQQNIIKWISSRYIFFIEYEWLNAKKNDSIAYALELYPFCIKL